MEWVKFFGVVDSYIKVLRNDNEVYDVVFIF